MFARSLRSSRPALGNVEEALFHSSDVESEKEQHLISPGKNSEEVRTLVIKMVIKGVNVTHIAAALFISRLEIEAIAQEEGLDLKRTPLRSGPRAWSLRDISRLSRAWAKGEGLPAIAERLNRTVMAVRKKRAALVLPARERYAEAVWTDADVATLLAHRERRILAREHDVAARKGATASESDPREPVVRQLGERIRDIRLARQMSISELGAASGHQTPAMQLIEIGLRKPSIESLRRIAAALKIATADLFPGLPNQKDIFNSLRTLGLYSNIQSVREQVEFFNDSFIALSSAIQKTVN